mgnify:CR=1 FL=1
MPEYLRDAMPMASGVVALLSICFGTGALLYEKSRYRIAVALTAATCGIVAGVAYVVSA